MKRAHRRIAAAAIAALALVVTVLVALPARGEEAPQVGGVVTDRATGNPVAGACVELYENVRPTQSMCVGADGRYAFNGLLSTASNLRLKANAPGFAETWAPAAPDFGNAAVLSIVSGPVAQEITLNGPVGTVAGQILDPGGEPASFVTVTLWSVSSTWTVSTTSRTDGGYVLANVPTGSYTVEFARSDLQNARRGTAVVASGATTTVDSQFETQIGIPLTRYTVAGTVRDPAGAFVTGVEISAFNDQWHEVARTISADGTFSLAGLIGIGYRFRARKPGYVDQWWTGGTTFGSGVRYLPTNGLTPVNMLMVTGSGTIRGQVLGPNGQPLRANVTVRRASSPLSVVEIRTSGDDGTFVFTGLPAQSYRITVTRLGLESLQATLDGATVIELPDGADLTVITRWPPRGRVEVTVVDAATGLAVPDVCLRLGPSSPSGEQCTGSEGVVAFESAVPGTALLTADSNTRYRGTTQRLTVVSGETVRVTVALEPAGAISLWVGGLNGVVPSVCVYVAHERLGVPESSGCAGSHGLLTIHAVPVGPVQLFVVPDSTGPGAQWVGTSGGTGVRQLAARIWVRQGETTTAPPVLPDPAAEPVQVSMQGPGLASNVCTVPFGRFLTTGGFGPLTSQCSISAYLVSAGGLGPYVWPIALGFGETTIGWSGGASDRASATYLDLSAGTPVEHEITVPARAPLSVTPPDVPGLATRTFYSAVTGDVVSVAFDSTPDPALPPVPVYVRFSTDAGVSCWYVGEPPYGGTPRRPAPPTARAVTAPASLSLTLGTNCRSDAVVPVSWNAAPTKPRTYSWGSAAAEGASGTPTVRTFTAQDVALARLALRLAVYGRA
jgi:hypothetical protein